MSICIFTRITVVQKYLSHVEMMTPNLKCNISRCPQSLLLKSSATCNLSGITASQGFEPNLACILGVHQNVLEQETPFVAKLKVRSHSKLFTMVTEW